MRLRVRARRGGTSQGRIGLVEVRAAAVVLLERQDHGAHRERHERPKVGAPLGRRSRRATAVASSSSSFQVLAEEPPERRQDDEKKRNRNERLDRRQQRAEATRARAEITGGCIGTRSNSRAFGRQTRDAARWIATSGSSRTHEPREAERVDAADSEPAKPRPAERPRPRSSRTSSRSASSATSPRARTAAR